MPEQVEIKIKGQVRQTDVAVVDLYTPSYIEYHYYIGAAEDSGPCAVDRYIIDQAPKKMKSIRWLDCESCDKWFHGFCIKAKPSDSHKKKWLCSKCNTE